MTAKRVLVIGAGPAGVSAALWARSRGLTCVLMEREARPGGQLQAIYFHPRQLPGVETGDGPEMAAASLRQLEAAGVEWHAHTSARSVDSGADGPEVTASDTTLPDQVTRHRADAVLIACGLARRRLGIPGEREFEGRGVSLSATRDRASLAGHDVLVIGGGDAAFENALLLADAGSRVTLAVRGEPGARRSFRERVARSDAIQVLTHTRVTALIGDQRLRGARLESAGGTHERECSAAVIKIGWAPDTAWCSPPLATDGDGFIRVAPGGRTSVAGFWAAGDITRPALFAIPLAHASAAAAIFDIAGALLDE
jgi:thioredoxin reductase (NADPH)